MENDKFGGSSRTKFIIFHFPFIIFHLSGGLDTVTDQGVMG